MLHVIVDVSFAADSTIDPLKMKQIYLIQGFGVYHAVNIPPWLYKTILLMLHKAEVTVCCEIHTKHINAL